MGSILDWITPILQFFYTAAHWLGLQVVAGIQWLFPQARLEPLVDPIGVMSLLTLALFTVQMARKVAWIVVATGWFLITLRMVMILLFEGR